MTRAQIAKILAENVRLRDKLLALAKECAGCRGSGRIPLSDELQAAFGKTQDCPDCEDIRAALR